MMRKPSMSVEERHRLLREIRAEKRRKRASLARPPGSALGWSYSPYRATLSLDGKRFAIVTPDGKDALSKKDVKLLLEALNRPAPTTKLSTRAEKGA